jgi:hypothetical protein
VPSTTAIHADHARYDDSAVRRSGRVDIDVAAQTAISAAAPPAEGIHSSSAIASRAALRHHITVYRNRAPEDLDRAAVRTVTPRATKRAPIATFSAARVKRSGYLNGGWPGESVKSGRKKNIAAGAAPATVSALAGAVACASVPPITASGQDAVCTDGN